MFSVLFLPVGDSLLLLRGSCSLLIQSCLLGLFFLLFFPSLFHKCCHSCEAHLVVQRQGSKGTFTLKMEPNILEPVAWPALSCSWPNVELRADLKCSISTGGRGKWISWFSHSQLRVIPMFGWFMFRSSAVTPSRALQALSAASPCRSCPLL